MQKELGRVIEQVSKEKGLERELVVEAVEDAMKSAARKTYGATLNLEAKFDPETGGVDVYKIQTVVAEILDPINEVSVEQARADMDPEAQIGDEILIELDTVPFGRIAAQAAKQNIVQKVRDYERTMIYNEFKELKDTIHSGIVMRFERRNIIVQVRPNVDAVLPEREQIPRERYRQGDRLRALITDVSETARGPQIILSRTSPALVKKLFEQEVPEVYEGIVEIKNVVREPGGRAKIAVVSNDSDVDPVGACVGMRGSRVQAVVQELRGERIDIVPWTPDETDFVCRALSPAKVSRIVIDEDAHAMEVIVPDDQLSLAIGRKGQNVRLAGKISGWKLDVHSEAEYEKRQRESRRSLQRIDGLGDVSAELLLADGYKSAAELSETAPEVISEVIDCDNEKALAIIASAGSAAEIERVESMVLHIAAGVSEAAYALRPPPEEPGVEGSADGEAPADGEATVEAAASEASADAAADPAASEAKEETAKEPDA
jgi:N utilization substance protein A